MEIIPDNCFIFCQFLLVKSIDLCNLLQNFQFNTICTIEHNFKLLLLKRHIHKNLHSHITTDIYYKPTESYNSIIKFITPKTG